MPGRELVLAANLNEETTTQQEFHALCAERGLKFSAQAAWPARVDTDIGSAGYHYLAGAVHSGSEYVVVERDEVSDVPSAVAHLDFSDGLVSVIAAGESREDALAMLSDLLAAIPEAEPGPDEVDVSFWTYTPHGPRRLHRTIDVPSWEEVETNYPSDVRGELGTLMGGEFRPSSGGQLILWQGPPGTGKTYALRALAWEWRSWADIHIVTDPERLFGEHSDYMLDVLLGEDEMLLEARAPGTSIGHPASEPAPPKWKILVMEDTGELLSQDAKERTGQALSRLLNVVDGIIGQGLRVLVLVTTNEELKRLHPAVARPGRCAAQIAFKTFDPHEAKAWLGARGCEGYVGAATIADLYARLEGREAAPRESVGFVSAG